MKIKLTLLVTSALLIAGLYSQTASSDGHGITANATDTVDSSLPIGVARFSVENASLGKAKHQDTAVIVRDSAAGMLLVDVIEELRDSGFADVAEATDGAPAGGYLLDGEFTEFNPGSQSARVLWGFGAGKSRVCVKATLTKDGNVVGEFSGCQKSLGWGDSQQQLEAEVDRIGVTIGQYLVAWSKK